jgi:hypothetical protein
MSQQDVGNAIRAPKQLVGEWERGEVTPGVMSLIRWADALGCIVVVRRRKRGVVKIEKVE